MGEPRRPQPPVPALVLPAAAGRFPSQLGSVDVEDFYRAVNKVEPSLIRVDADQVTYNMHVILRFELEQEIINGAIALEDVPEAWNAKMKEYLGIDVPEDARGVLQDVHWSGGVRLLPHVFAGQRHVAADLGEGARGDPDLDEQFERGEFGALREWLGENAAPLRAQVHAAGDAATSGRRRRWTPGRTSAT